MDTHQPKPKIHFPPLTLSCFPSLRRCCLHLVPLVPPRVTLVPLRACSWWVCTHQVFSVKTLLCHPCPAVPHVAEGLSLGSSSCTCTGFASCPSSSQSQIWSLAARLSGLGQVRTVCCSKFHWVGLLCITPVPKTSLFLSQEPAPSGRQCCPSTTALPPCNDVPLNPHQPSPLLLSWELVPGVQRKGKTRGTSQPHAGQQLQPGGTKPAGAWLTSPPSNGASLGCQEKVGSTNCGG